MTNFEKFGKSPEIYKAKYALYADTFRKNNNQGAIPPSELDWGFLRASTALDITIYGAGLYVRVCEPGRAGMERCGVAVGYGSTGCDKGFPVYDCFTVVMDGEGHTTKIGSDKVSVAQLPMKYYSLTVEFLIRNIESGTEKDDVIKRIETAITDRRRRSKLISND